MEQEQGAHRRANPGRNADLHGVPMIYYRIGHLMTNLNLRSCQLGKYNFECDVGLA